MWCFAVEVFSNLVLIRSVLCRLLAFVYSFYDWCAYFFVGHQMLIFLPSTRLFWYLGFTISTSVLWMQVLVMVSFILSQKNEESLNHFMLNRLLCHFLCLPNITHGDWWFVHVYIVVVTLWVMAFIGHGKTCITGCFVLFQSNFHSELVVWWGWCENTTVPASLLV